MTAAVERYDHIDQASRLWLKGHNFSQIARALDISPAAAKSLINDYKKIIENQAAEDPDFLDRLQENTLKALDEMSIISKEAWDTYEYAKDAEMVNQMVNALKLAKETAEAKAKLLNLLGVKNDGGNVAQMRKLERINEIVSNVIKEVVADCPKCRQEAQIRLAEAFTMMGRQEDAAEMRELNEDYVEAEIVEEEEEFDHAAMHNTIIGDKY